MIEPRGGSRQRTAGGACSGTSAARTARNPVRPFTTISTFSSTTTGVNAISSSQTIRTNSGSPTIAEDKTAEGKLYFCAVKDAFSGKFVGYSSMKALLAVRAIRNAVAMRGNVNGCIIHSDRGSQFRSRKLRRELSCFNLVGSMGRVASCGEDAAMESFFSLLQNNVLNRRSWATREELRISIVAWIERTYQRRRRQARLGRLTPVEFETIINKNLALAA